MFPHATCLLWNINNRRRAQALPAEAGSREWIHVTGGTDAVHCSIRNIPGPKATPNQTTIVT
ncbi:peptidylprolyl isomerase [Anopheles sinensis]|uniref:Peptidylprolyl isomerase n=1 Tax=Anopheles sinensis TaxID=74873 RepID=A0A084WKI2_ANOSI|nr:peptidylprolyl isomerase [Anopheles sinensis]